MPRHSSDMPNFSDVLTISEAADVLGVSTATLRNWDRSGKLKPRRHPQNGYRIYLHQDLEEVLRSAELATQSDHELILSVDWTNVHNAEHFVQFYEADEWLVESASGFAAAALRAGGVSVVAATPEHCSALERKLISCGLDLGAYVSAKRYIVLDARETLSLFIDGTSIDKQRFDAFISRSVGSLLNDQRPLHAFGEMVALLWNDGNRKAAIELEHYWNQLAKEHGFSLLCTYPIAGFAGDLDSGGIEEVCSCHSRIFPAESYPAASTEEDRSRAIVLLQKQSQSLSAEVAHRREIDRQRQNRVRDLENMAERCQCGAFEPPAVSR